MSAFQYLRGELMNKGVRDSPPGASRLPLLHKRVHLSSSVGEGLEAVKSGPRGLIAGHKGGYVWLTG